LIERVHNERVSVSDLGGDVAEPDLARKETECRGLKPRHANPSNHTPERHDFGNFPLSPKDTCSLEEVLHSTRG
jgi:hypothetical protein